MKIAFDLDETLVRFIPVFEKVLYDQYGKFIDKDQTQYHIKVDGLSDDDVHSLVCDALNEIYEFYPYPYAKELLRLVHEVTGEPVTIITTRPVLYATATVLLMKNLFGCVPFRISMVNGYKQKLAHLAGFDAFVEDRRATAIYLANNGIKVFLVDRPWNQCDAHQNIKRIVHLGELMGKRFS